MKPHPQLPGGAGRASEGIRRDEGFTLLELSIVLVIIGMILGAVAIGKDLQRAAEHQRIYAKFVQPWGAAYNEYFARTGVVVGDDQLVPTLKVNEGTDILCDEIVTPNNDTPGTLYALMDSVGIEMPPGRAEGREARYVYLDSNGNPQEMQICFQNVTWPDSSDTSLNNKNTMVLFGLTPDLARQLDSLIDGRLDARYGLFRQDVAVVGTSPCTPCGAGTASLIWNTDNTDKFGTMNGANLDENQVAVVKAFYRMSQ